MARCSARLGAMAVVVALGLGLSAVPALAEEPTTTTPVPATTTEPPPTTATTTEPAPPNPPPQVAEELPDLRITAALDRDRYRAGDQVRVTVTVSNVGAGWASSVHAYGGGDLEGIAGWGDLGSDAGATIPPGGTLVAELTARIPDTARVGINVNGGVYTLGSESNPYDNLFSTSALLIDATGHFGGRIFADRNLNGRLDGDEVPLSGVTVRISGGVPWGEYERTTDDQGRFSFRDIPAGQYFDQYSHPTGWVVSEAPFDGVVDDSGRNADLLIPATRPLWESLEAFLIFDRESYPAGAETSATVVLVNSGAELRGVTARCSHSQDGPDLSGGAGWGALAEGGPGVTVPAGSTRTVLVSEPVPPASPRYGYVSAFCSFRAAGYPASAEVHAQATAQVPGRTGGGRGRIFQDHNTNGWVDEGEAVPGVPVVITDQHTGVPIGRSTTGADGGFAVDDVPAGVHDLRIEGPWQPRFSTGFRFPVVAGEPLAELYFAVQPGARPQPNLKVSAVFDKRAYDSGDRIVARVTVTNIGEVAAEGVRVSLDGRGPTMRHDFNSWGDFSWHGPGARIEAGASRAVEIVGNVWNPAEPVVLFAGGFAAANGEFNQQNNGFRIVAPVTKTHGTFAGIVYGDKNNNGAMDPGEGLGSVEIRLSGQAIGTSFQATTDADGRFAFRDIPTGRYRASYHVLGGYLVPDGDIVVDAGEHPDVLVRVARPLSEFLTVSVEFTKDSYAVGEQAHLTVTLTNRGSAPLTGITALCTGAGWGYEIDSSAPGWGELSYLGPGTTVGAHQTRTFDVWSVVPEGAFTWGFVGAGCVFGNPPEAPGNPVVGDRAKVPGGTGPARGRLVYDRNSDDDVRDDGVADTKVLLLDVDTGAVVARARSNANGDLDFGTMPAGEYRIRLVGPWKLRFPDAHFQVLHERDDHMWSTIYLVPGANQPDPDAPPQDQPAPQGTVAPGGHTGGHSSSALASTGASVLGLLVMGWAALLLGLGLLVTFRRTALR